MKLTCSKSMVQAASILDELLTSLKPLTMNRCKGEDQRLDGHWRVSCRE